MPFPKLSPVNGTIICSLYSIAFLKMWSYIQVNQWCREHARIAERRLGIKSPSLVDFSKDLGESTQLIFSTCLMG